MTSYCRYCNTDHRSLLEPDGGDSCDPYAVKPRVTLEELEAQIRKARKAS
jgi:hypothetical protein